MLTVWSLTPGYEYEYSYTATGSYTYDGTTLSMTLGNEQVKTAIAGKTIVKVVCVPKRIVNIVVK